MVKVQWHWLTLPAFLVVAGNVVLALTLRTSRKKTPWKSSILALLFQGLKHVDRDENATSCAIQQLADNCISSFNTLIPMDALCEVAGNAASTFMKI